MVGPPSAAFAGTEAAACFLVELDIALTAYAGAKGIKRDFGGEHNAARAMCRAVESILRVC